MKNQVFDFDFKAKSGPLEDKVTGETLQDYQPLIYRVNHHGKKGIQAGAGGRFHGDSQSSYASGTRGFILRTSVIFNSIVPTYEMLVEEYDNQSGYGYQFYLSYGVIDGNGYQKSKLVLTADDSTQVLPQFIYPHLRDGQIHDYELRVDMSTKLATLLIDDNVPLFSEQNDLTSLVGKNIPSPHISVLAEKNANYNVNGTVFELSKILL